jgi:hypothetical protein
MKTRYFKNQDYEEKLVSKATHETRNKLLPLEKKFTGICACLSIKTTKVSVFQDLSSKNWSLCKGISEKKKIEFRVTKEFAEFF